MLLLFENDAQGSCVLEGPLVFVLGETSASGGCLALVVMWMVTLWKVTLYRCRLVVVGATKRADIL